MPPTGQIAVDAVNAGEVSTLMLVGGRGHTTDALMAAMSLDPNSAETRNVTEAEVMAAWMHEVHGIEDLVLETRSTNCGNNITLAEQVAERHGLRAHADLPDNVEAAHRAVLATHPEWARMMP